MIKFSITIPAYKSSFLREAIESVTAQAYRYWELVVVDDCSPEDLANIVKPYLEDKRISYYRNNRNCGAEHVVDNWNICLQHCTGDYVICMGDDDRLLPCCLEEYAKLIEEHPGLNVYHAWTQIIDEQGEVTSLQEPRPEWESALSLLWNRWASRNKQFIGDFCYLTSHLKQANGYYKLPLAWGSDDITAARAAQDKGIANMQCFGFQYRVNSQTITSSAQHARMKLKATLGYYEWATAFLSDISRRTDLTETEHAFLLTIEAQRKNYFLKSFGKDCIDGTKGNPFKLTWFYRQLRPLHIQKSLFLRWYASSVFHLFSK